MNSIFALLLVALSLSSAIAISAARTRMSNFYQDLATRTFAKVSKEVKVGGRRLDEVEYIFETYICPSFEDEFQGEEEHPEDLSCTCESKSLSIQCKTGETCEYDESCNKDICGTFDIMIKINLDPNGDLAAIGSIVQVKSEFKGADYEGVRLYVDVKDMSCAQFITLGGLEYRCSACSVCDEQGRVHFDCSNIVPDATSNGCNDPSEAESEEKLFILCPEGGAPKPTTKGSIPRGFATSSALSHSFSVVAMLSSLVVFLAF